MFKSSLHWINLPCIFQPQPILCSSYSLCIRCTKIASNEAKIRHRVCNSISLNYWTHVAFHVDSQGQQGQGQSQSGIMFAHFAPGVPSDTSPSHRRTTRSSLSLILERRGDYIAFGWLRFSTPGTCALSNSRATSCPQLHSMVHMA